MDTATFAHPNATPRTLAVSAALVEAGAPLSDISRRLYRSKPPRQLRLFGRVLDRLEAYDDGTRRVVDAARRRPRGDRDPAAAVARASSTCSPRPRTRRWPSCSRRPATTTRISVRTKPGGVDATVLTGRFGGGGHARAAGATVPLPVDRHGDAVLAEARRPRPPSRADVARSSLGPGLDGILIVDKPIGPTSHDIVGLVRRLAATKRVGHGGTLDPFASGVLPMFLGRATRVVEFHLADRKAYRATVCFGASSTTDDLEGELTPSEGPAPIRDAVEEALPGSSGRSDSVRRRTRRSRSVDAGRTRWRAPARPSSSRSAT